MAKQYYTINSFAKGMNNLKDPRDIAEDEANFVQNMSIESQGKIKSAGGFYGHGVGNSGAGLIGNGKYVADRGSSSTDANAITVVGSGGYNLFYFESDHSADYDSSLAGLRTSNGTDADGVLTFQQTSTSESSGFTPPASVETTDTEAGSAGGPPG
jgi:hypothetical protein|tara:strand:- start:4593 stop:5060 length:468 start_codon:yes stop_codon:yes gene_type:complete